MRGRLGLNKKCVEKVAQRALEEGIPHSDTKGKLHKYLDKQALGFDHKHKWRIYNGYLYCFSFDDILITVLPLTYQLRKCL